AQPWATALLACATAATLAFILLGALRQEREAVQVPLKGMAIGACLIALILLIFGLSLPATGIIASRLIWMAALWFAMGLAEDSAGILLTAQAVLFLAVALRTVASLDTSSWFQQLELPLLDVRSFEAIGLALGLTALGFSVLRRVVPARWQQMRPSCASAGLDRAMSIMLAAALGAMVLCALFPALQIEFASPVRRLLYPRWAAQAVAARSWTILGVIFLTFCLWLWKTKSRAVLLGIVAVAAIASPMLATRWADQGAAASALRWVSAVFLIVASIPLLLRDRLPGAIGGNLLDRSFRRDWMALLVALCAVPIVLFSIYPAELTLTGEHFGGPSPLSFFGRIGNSTSYLVPLLVLAIVFVSYAVYERSTAWAVAGAAVFNLTTTLGYALAVATKGGSLGTHELIRLVQLNVLTLALFSLFWQAARAMVYRSTSLPTPAPLWTLAALCVAGNLLLILPAGLHLFGSPQWQSPHLSTIGDPLGWLALALTLAALGIPLRQGGRWMSAGVVAPLLIAIALMGALGAQRSSQSTWISFHIALCGFVLASGALPGMAVLIARRRRGVAEPIAAPPPFAEASTDSSIPPIPLQYQRDDRSTSAPSELVSGEGIEPGFLRWTAALTSIAILFALRGMFGDPQRPWWSASAALLLSILWIGVACWSLAPRLLYVGGMLLNLGVSFWCIDNLSASREPLLDLLLANVGVLALFGIATLVVHLHVFLPRLKQDSRLSFHQFAAGLCTILIVLVAAAVANTSLLPIPALLWAAWAGSLACAIGTLWDSRSRFALLEIYLLGLSTVGLLLGQWPLPAQEFHWEATLMLGAFVLAASALVGLRESLVQLAARV
ncbi:MAG TPA: hypothetical protein VN541_15410, partial [Tepidisphaeraceae bacterium]|nr:hypothetical protein [Tepidisphaeraceae bacterium]